jgi:hypothetical protein
MNNVFMMLLGSAILGFLMALRYNVYMLVVSSSIVALVAAIGAWIGRFGLLASLAITLACITVSQTTYLLFLWLRTSHARVLTDKPSNGQGFGNGDHLAR